MHLSYVYPARFLTFHLLQYLPKHLVPNYFWWLISAWGSFSWRAVSFRFSGGGPGSHPGWMKLVCGHLLVSIGSDPTVQSPVGLVTDQGLSIPCGHKAGWCVASMFSLWLGPIVELSQVEKIAHFFSSWPKMILLLQLRILFLTWIHACQPFLAPATRGIFSIFSFYWIFNTSLFLIWHFS